MGMVSAAVEADWLTLIVAEKSDEADGIVRLVLRNEGGAALPPFAAGAHIEVEVANGERRSYSLCNGPHDAGGYEIAVLLEPNGRGGSRHMHERVERGDRLRAKPPRNLFPLAEDGHSLLVAGGIGITPLLAMAEHLARAGRSFDLHIAVRSPARAAFRRRLAAAPFAARVHWHFDDGAPEQAFDLERILAEAPPASRLYVCGPTGFMDAVLGGARAAGWPDTRLHCEYFAAASGDHSADGAFDLFLAKTGRTIRVPAGATAARALLDAGVDIRLSCEQGVCGTCLLPVIEGVPDHRDHYLGKAERAANRLFAPCCSRARTPRLTLDY
ncbi:vanillate O-demethylase ferredoxin subunit [Roseiarcus fermentans]|uniref:Vanillate O-demethylase ferredoxin subunit n=1 Tax=Roseiarcus fermentans TaxID=1473586 RepID=A0A366F7D6_9HYPH|nr:PDR/VanB family oxidoreductase [Roseiarcus fermentans]RBP09669.1 vanillate O-demethylase ferredoxin subunit [Roseiarcus fermentans]